MNLYLRWRQKQLMIKRNMISVMHRRRWALYLTTVLAVVGMVIGVLLLTNSRSSAIIEGGSGDTGSSTGVGYSTGNGHGWKLFEVAGTGPSGGFRSTDWATVQSRCNTAGANKVWAYVIRNNSGASANERGYTFKNTNADYGFNNTTTRSTGGSGRAWWVDRPAAGGDPYKYNSSGVYDGIGRFGGQSDYGTADRVVETVRTKYTGEGGNLARWGFEVGWFCWSDNPPWIITATTTANKAGIEVGEEVVWTHQLVNSGPNRTNANIIWQYQNKGADWPNTPGTNQTWASGQVNGATTSITSRYTAVPGDFGKVLCRSTTAAPSSNTNAAATESAQSCVVVGKKPKVQVHGGDLSVGKVFTGTSVTSQVNTSTSFRAAGAGELFGSWVEYGIFATGTVTGTASGSAFAAISTNPNVCQRSYLSFTLSTNTCSAATTVIGGYTPARLIPDVSVNFPQPGAALGASVTPNSLLSGAGTYIGTRTGNLTINASNLQPGKTVVLKVTGTATIVGNQVNNNDNNGAGYRGASQLPQLVIIANKIVIANSVSNVDAWLVANGADGTVETCDTGSSTYALSGAARLTGSKCNNSLTVNGPVMAKHLWLRRTANADGASPGTPAEVFNLRADAYLWAEAQSVSAGRIQTVYTTELPPRL